MERYFILGQFNTFYDWRFILTAKDITPPEPKTNYVDISGMDGSLDLSEALTGGITYKDRTISASFWTSEGTYDERTILLRGITAALHGKKLRIVEPDDPGHYFYGRVKIKSVQNILPYATFTIEATCEPWRYANNETVRTVNVSGESKTDIIINNNGMRTVSPVVDIVADENLEITYDNTTIWLTTGSYRVPDLKLYQGANVVSVLGNGSISFTYREAVL